MEFECGCFFVKSTILRPSVKYGQYATLLDQYDRKFLNVNHKVPH